MLVKVLEKVRFESYLKDCVSSLMLAFHEMFENFLGKTRDLYVAFFNLDKIHKITGNMTSVVSVWVKCTFVGSGEKFLHGK